MTCQTAVAISSGSTARRPHFIRRCVIKEGEMRFAALEDVPRVEL